MAYELLREKTGNSDDLSPNDNPPAEGEQFTVYHRLPGVGGYRTGGFRFVVRILDTNGDDCTSPACFTIWDKNTDGHWFKFQQYYLRSNEGVELIPMPDGIIWIQVTDLPDDAQTTKIYIKPV